MSSRNFSRTDGNPVTGPDDVERNVGANVSQSEMPDAPAIDHLDEVHTCPFERAPKVSTVEGAAPNVSAFEVNHHPHGAERAETNTSAAESNGPRAEANEGGHLPPPPLEPCRRRGLVVPPLRLDLAVLHDAATANGPRAAPVHIERSHAMDVRDPSNSPRENTQTGLGPVEPPRTNTLKSAAGALDTSARNAAPRLTTMNSDAARIRPSKVPRRVAIVLATALVSLIASVGVAALVAKLWRRVAVQDVTSTRSIIWGVPSPESRVEATLIGPKLNPLASAASGVEASQPLSVALAAQAPAQAPAPAIRNDGLAPALIPYKPKGIASAKHAGLCPCDKTKKRNAVYDELPTTDGPLP